MTCLRCGGEGHDLQYCYVPFSKAWIGQNAVRIRLKLKTERVIDYEITLTEEEAAEHLRRYDAIKGGSF